MCAKKNLKASAESIECDKCFKTLHAICAKQSKGEFERLVENEFSCFVCVGSDGEAKAELKEIKIQLKQLDHFSDPMQIKSEKF